MPNVIYPRRSVLIGLGATALVRCNPSNESGDFYAGKTIHIMVGYAPGGGYDSFARAVARYLPKYIPGNPNVVVQNMPGTGSMRAAQYIYQGADQDGTYICASGLPPLMLPLLDESMRIIDPLKLSWLPSAGEGLNTMAVWHEVPIDSFLDARNVEVTMAGGGPYERTTLFVHMFNSIFGTKFRMIHGYSGSAEILLAIERGEIQGNPGINWSSLKTMRPEWLRDKKAKILLQYGASEPAPDLPGVPFAPDLATNAMDKTVIELATSPLLVAHPFFMGPDVPADRVAIMRKGFWDTYHDPQFAADAMKLEVDIDPAPAEEVTALINRLYNAPPDVVARLRQYYAEGSRG